MNRLTKLNITYLSFILRRFSNRIKHNFIFISFVAILLSGSGFTEAKNPGRGTVAVRTSPSEVFISWRRLGRESKNSVRYNLYRNTTLIASNLNACDYLDNSNSNFTYQVAAVINGVIQTKSYPVEVTTFRHVANTRPSVEIHPDLRLVNPAFMFPPHTYLE